MGERFKIVLLGGSGVGKSAITLMFLQGTFLSEYDPTLEETFRKTMAIENKSCLLDILDTAGQESYTTMESRYIQNGDGFLIVYSVTSETTFEKVSTIYDLVLRVKDVDSFPTVILGNKSDLATQRKVTPNQGKDLSNQYSLPFFETSALQNKNVTESFSSLVQILRKKRETDLLTKNKKKKNV